MVYSRDWLEANPIDHTKFSAQPGAVRSHKVDISDRLKAMFKGFVSGDLQTDEGVIDLPFNVQGSDPGATASKVKLYAKDVSSKAELFLEDEDANVIQLSSAGKTKAENLAGVYPASAVADLVNLLPFIYPIGCIYTSIVSTNPATVFGFGTWVAFGAGRVPVGLDSGDTDFDVVEETGGSKTHTLSVAQMPLHGHPWRSGAGSGGDNSGGLMTDVSSTTNRAAFTGTLSDTIGQQIGGEGGGGSHNNVQPYIVVHMFKRTA